MENLTKEKSNLIKMLGVLAILASIYLIAITISEIKGYKFIGGGAPASNVISFEGKGEVNAKPDIATLAFTIRDTEKDVKIAQDAVTAKEKATLDFLEKSGVEKKDIKTENYSSYPKYEPIPCYGYGGSCQSNTISGYEVSEYITVKVRDITKAGEIAKGLGGLGINIIDGPNFAIEKEDEFKAQARKLAIDEAKAKAKVLSKDLGVRLVRIVNFSENGNYPISYLAKGVAFDSVAERASTPAPELPTGENKIISNVTITYEIR